MERRQIKRFWQRLALVSALGFSYPVAAAPMDAARIYARIWLQGPYQAAADSMVRTPIYKSILDTLRRDWNSGFLSRDLTSPLTKAVPRALDFILVYLRSTEDEGQVVSRNIAVLGTDGFLYDLRGDPGVPMNVRNGTYFIVLQHRNHLGVQSRSPVLTSTLQSNLQGQFYDFTDLNNCYGADSWQFNPPLVLLEKNVYGLYAGNTNGSIGIEAIAGVSLSTWPKIIASLDRVAIQKENGDQPAYTRADANLNGVVVFAIDYALVQINSGTAAEVPFPLTP